MALSGSAGQKMMCVGLSHLRIEQEGQARIGPGGQQPSLRALTLTETEAAWLEAYCKQLEERFPGCVEQVIVYGPRTEGFVHGDLELNTLVVISEEARPLARRVGDIGLDLDMSGYFVAPSLAVRTPSELAEIRRWKDPLFWPAIDDGVRIL